MIELHVAGLVGAVLAAFAAGFLIGGWLLGSASERKRILALEQKLEGEREAAATFRKDVESHFNQTAGIFRDLTQQYASLYDHLASGAADLCRDGVPSLPPELEVPRIGSRTRRQDPGPGSSG